MINICLGNIMITEQVQTKTKEENQKAVGHLVRKSLDFNCYTAYNPWFFVVLLKLPLLFYPVFLLHSYM